MPPDHHVESSPPDEPNPSPAPRPWSWAWSPACLALGGLLLAVLACYYRLWWPGLILIKRDATMTLLPVKQYLIDRLRAGEFPQWFPYDTLGRSFIGVAHTGVFHPFTLLYFVFPAPDALRLSTLASCLLAAGGAFWLGRHLGLSSAGALLAGIAFACSGYVASMTDNIVYLYSTCLIPLLLLAVERAASGRLAWVVAAAGLWATVFLNGDIQTGYYLAFAALLWVVMRAVSPKRALAVLAAVAGLAALLAGIQLGPSLSVYLGSGIRHSPAFQENLLEWSTHPLRLLTMLAWPVSTEADPGTVMAAFFGGQYQPPWAESLYLGIPVVGLAVLGAARRPDLRALVALGVLALLLALGRYGGLYDLFRHAVPLWSAFRYPEKWMGFASFSVAMLAGAGLDALREDRNDPRPWLLAAGACLAVGLFLGTATGRTLLAVLHDTSLTLARDVAGTSARSLLAGAAAALGVGLLILAAQRGWIGRRVLTGNVAAIAAVTLIPASMQAYKTGPSDVYSFTPPLLSALRAEEGGALSPGRFRVAEPHFFQGGRWPKQLEEALGYYGASAVFHRQALSGGLVTDFGIEGFRVTLPGVSAHLEALRAVGLSNEVYARFNVAYLVLRRSLVTDRSLLDRPVGDVPDFDLVLVRNPVPVRPRAYLSRRPEPATAPPLQKELFARPDFLNGEVDVIESSGVTLPGPSPAGRAVIERYEPERVVVRTEASAPAVLVLVDAFDPGWRATLDAGDGLPILRANLLMRAVAVPAGTHRVTFVYRTPSLMEGTAASAAGVALPLVLIGFAWRRRRGSSAGPKEPEHVSTTAG